MCERERERECVCELSVCGGIILAPRYPALPEFSPSYYLPQSAVSQSVQSSNSTKKKTL